MGVLAGAGERDVGAVSVGEAISDHVRTIDGLALGGERVRDIPQPSAASVELLALPGRLAAIPELQDRALTAAGNV